MRSYTIRKKPRRVVTDKYSTLIYRTVHNIFQKMKNNAQHEQTIRKQYEKFKKRIQHTREDVKNSDTKQDILFKHTTSSNTYRGTQPTENKYNAQNKNTFKHINSLKNRTSTSGRDRGSFPVGSIMESQQIRCTNKVWIKFLIKFWIEIWFKVKY